MCNTILRYNSDSTRYGVQAISNQTYRSFWGAQFWLARSIVSAQTSKNEKNESNNVHSK